MPASIYDFAVETITGNATSLEQYRGEVLLVVNVASQCGLTPQYDALEKLYSRFHGCRFEVLGFPANDFAGQEPGADQEILQFCKASFGVDFPLFSKISVTGSATHPLYEAMIAAQPKAWGPGRDAMRENLAGFLSSTNNGTTNPEPGILWNFEKFLIDRSGAVVGRFSPEVTPDDPALVAAIEAALAA